MLRGRNRARNLAHSVTHSAIVTDSSAIGFVASALVLAAFGMKDMVNLRIVAICSNVAFITYAVWLNLPPILILHVILLPRMAGGWRRRCRVEGWFNAPLIRYAAKLPARDEARRMAANIAKLPELLKNSDLPSASHRRWANPLLN